MDIVKILSSYIGHNISSPVTEVSIFEGRGSLLICKNLFPIPYIYCCLIFQSMISIYEIPEWVCDMITCLEDKVKCVV